MPFIHVFFVVFGVFLESFATFSTVTKKTALYCVFFFKFAYCLTGSNKLYLNY